MLLLLSDLRQNFDDHKCTSGIEPQGWFVREQEDWVIGNADSDETQRPLVETSKSNLEVIMLKSMGKTIFFSQNHLGRQKSHLFKRRFFTT